MKTVACVYWKGAFRGRENIYSPDWVYRLKNMVTKQMPFDEAFRFICLTNVPEKFNDTMETITLEHDWNGWWSKIELFKPNQFEGKVLYLDLDTFVVGKLESFFELETDFAISSSFTPTSRRAVPYNEVIKYNSSVMLWDSKLEYISDKLYNHFNYNIHTRMFRGDQDWIGSRLPELDTFVKRWVVKYRDLPNGDLMQDNKVVLGMSKGMPQKNKSIVELKDWAKKIWKR